MFNFILYALMAVVMYLGYRRQKSGGKKAVALLMAAASGICIIAAFAALAVALGPAGG